MHLTGLGDFQLKQVDILEDPCPLRQDHKGFKGEPMDLENPANEKVRVKPSLILYGYTTSSWIVNL